MTRTALITGIAGQHGSYLADLLLERGYAVHGIGRRAAGKADSHVARLIDRGLVSMHGGDLADAGSLSRLVAELRPDESEETRFHPRSPYGVAKLFGHWITVNYREAHGLHASSGILFNHESPRRGESFVTRKVTLAIAAIRAGRQQSVRLGNLDAQRDWGHARDYVEGMWLMLQQDVPDDHVLATGETRTVRAFVEAAFTVAGMPLTFEGAGLAEVGRDRDGVVRVEIAREYYRPAEVELLIGDPRKARDRLGWSARTSFAELVREMVEEDLRSDAQ